jgi:hypothetical protein
MTLRIEATREVDERKGFEIAGEHLSDEVGLFWDDTWAPININDPVALLRWLYLGGPQLPAPTPLDSFSVLQSCGVEARERDGLGCDSFPLCE